MTKDGVLTEAAGGGTHPFIDRRLVYGLVLPPGADRRISLFQRFPEALILHRRALESIVRLPATLMDPVIPLPDLLGARAIGLSGWRIRPLSAESLDGIDIPASMPIWTLFSATADAAVSIRRFQARQLYRPLHVSLLDTEGAINLGDLSVMRLREHVLALVEAHSPLAELGPIVERWSERPGQAGGIRRLGHYSLLPNQMTLMSAGMTLGVEVPDWTSRDPAAFVDAMLEGVAEIDALRARAKIGPAIRFLPPRPDLWLVAPSTMPGFKAHVPLDAAGADERRAAEELFRRIERQRSYNPVRPPAETERYRRSEFAQSLAATRNAETALFAAAIGTRTAGSLASTLRLQPSINLVAARVSVLADNIRSGARTRPAKIARMFGEIQQLLTDAVGERFLARIADAPYGVKLVTDAPLEWLPVNGLPLCLESDVSRIAATPGDVTMLQLLEHEPLRLRIEDFKELLLVSAFSPQDRLAPVLRKAIGVMAPQLEDALVLRDESVTDEPQFMRALNTYDGPLMIYDGHGIHPEGGDGMLRIADLNVDVRRLRGRVRVPPIIVLSACDTHAAGRSAYTTASAFLALGARTVLATTLPIGGAQGAIFVARLLLRIARYLPAAVGAYGRVVVGARSPVACCACSSLPTRCAPEAETTI